MGNLYFDLVLLRWQNRFNTFLFALSLLNWLLNLLMFRWFLRFILNLRRLFTLNLFGVIFWSDIIWHFKINIFVLEYSSWLNVLSHIYRWYFVLLSLRYRDKRDLWLIREGSHEFFLKLLDLRLKLIWFRVVVIHWLWLCYLLFGLLWFVLLELNYRFFMLDGILLDLSWLLIFWLIYLLGFDRWSWDFEFLLLLNRRDWLILGYWLYWRLLLLDYNRFDWGLRFLNNRWFNFFLLNWFLRWLRINNSSLCSNSVFWSHYLILHFDVLRRLFRENWFNSLFLWFLREILGLFEVFREILAWFNDWRLAW